MHPHIPPTPPGPPAPHPAAAAEQQQLNSLRESTHRAQRAFLTVNAVPFTIGTVLSCFTGVPAVRVHGVLTLGMVWGILQCGLFVATAWLHEARSTRLSDPIEQSLTSGAVHTAASGAAPVNGSWR
ncbi:hypothetical protein AQJ58_36415 [Streptomyces sp. DSM 15324]|nr:hypothetical protein AQJ58_36415 [Streptomyces sp. DSM 15324]